MPTAYYSDLCPTVIALATERGFTQAILTSHVVTPQEQHCDTLAAIASAQLDLRKLGATKALELALVGLSLPDEAQTIAQRRRHRLAVAFGTLLASLTIQAAMQVATLEVCKSLSGRLCNSYGVDMNRYHPPQIWLHIDRWAVALGEKIATRDDAAPAHIGAIVFCVEEWARINLALSGPECMALALGEISKRRGVVDGVSVQAV